MFLKRLILCLSLSTSCFGMLAGAQPQPASQTQPADSLASVSGIVVRKYGLRVADARVSLSDGADSLLTLTGVQGTFSFINIRPGKRVIRISRVGFEPYVDSLELDPGSNIVYVSLKTPEEARKDKEAHTLHAAMVEAEADAMRMRGDTIVYNAAAVRTMQGDNAMQLLEQMPGVTRKDDKVQVFGTEVRRTYVNGMLVFGNDPTAALNALLANEVRQIKVYDEENKDDERAGLRRGRKDRVLDIITTHAISMAVDAHFLAGAGSDTSPDVNGHPQIRYALGGTANYFSEKLLIFANAGTDNIGRHSNRLEDILTLSPLQSSYRELTGVEAGIEKYWKDRFFGNNLHLSYRYDKAFERKEERECRQYFPVPDNPFQTYEADQAMRNRDRFHILDFSGVINDDRIKHLRASAFLAWEDRTMLQSASVIQSGAGIRAAQRERSSSENSRSFMSASLDWDNAVDGKKFSQVFHTALLSDDTGESSLQVDTSLSVTTKRLLSAGSDGRRQALSLSPSVRILLANGDRFSSVMELSYQFSADKRRDRKTAYNLLAAVPEINLANTFDYLFNGTEHLGTVRYKMNARQWQVMGSVDAGTALQRDESLLAAAGPRSWRFPILQSALSFQYGNAFSFLYSSHTLVPSVNQLRDRVNDDNALLLLTGNPDLKASQQHSMSAQYTKMTKQQGMLQLMTTASWHERLVVQRLLCFDSPGQWGAYSIPAGTSLITYGNAGGQRDIMGSVSYSRRFKLYRSRLSLSLSEHYSVFPQYAGDRLEWLDEHAPVAKASFNGTVSKRFRFSSSGDLVWHHGCKRGGEVLAEYLLRKLSGSVHYQFGKSGFSTVTYAWSGYSFLSGDRPDVDLHNLGALVGWRLCKGALAVSLSGNNLLDSTPSYVTSTTPQYSLETWKTYFGRSVMLNLSYRFNRTGAGQKYGGGLKDGTPGPLPTLFRSRLEQEEE